MAKIKNWQEYSYYLALHLKNKERHVFRQQFLSLHTNDKLAFIYMLNEHTRKRLYRYIEATEFAEIFGRLEASEQRMILEEVQPTYAQETIRAMRKDELVDFLSGFTLMEVTLYLRLLDEPTAIKVKRMLGYGKHTAGALMTTEYVVAHITDSVADVLKNVRIQGENAETIYYIYIIDDEEILRGVVSLREVLLHDSLASIQDIMQDKLLLVEADVDREIVLQIVRDYDLIALPVVEAGRLVGIVTVDDVMDIYYEETEENFGELASVNGAIDLDVGIIKATKVRLGWVMRLAIISLIPLIFIYFYEQYAYSIALIVPFLASMAGNAGVQSLAASISVKELGHEGDFRKLLQRDSVVAIVMATAIAGVVAIIAYGIHQPVLPIFLSSWLTIVISSLTGTTLPYIVKDSSIASSGVVTVCSDMLTVLLFITALVMS